VMELCCMVNGDLHLRERDYCNAFVSAKARAVAVGVR
jgi:hypothetical protein